MSKSFVCLQLTRLVECFFTKVAAVFCYFFVNSFDVGIQTGNVEQSFVTNLTFDFFLISMNCTNMPAILKNKICYSYKYKQIVMKSGSKSWVRVGFGYCFSGSGRVRVSKKSGFSPGFPGFRYKSNQNSGRVGVRVPFFGVRWVGFGYHKVGFFPLGFRVFGYPTTSLDRIRTNI